MKQYTVGVLGLGTIGIKLVEYLIEKNVQVIAYNFRNIENKKKRFFKTIERKIKYNKISLSDLDFLKQRVTFTDSLDSLAPCNFLIESLAEDTSLKKDIYQQLLKAFDQEKILCSTTSSLDLNELSGFYNDTKFVGLHFFNPPTIMKLIELSFPPNILAATKQTIYEFLTILDDKKVIELPPIQGYIVNRVLFAYINYAIEFFSDNFDDPRVVDDAMKLGTNSPMGPLELSDYIGNDVSLEILNEFHTKLNDERYKPHPILEEMVKENKLGRKTGKGFYNY